jgi:hypothetical protein
MAKAPMKMRRLPMSTEPGPQKVDLDEAKQKEGEYEDAHFPRGMKWRAMMGTADEGAEEANILEKE